MSRQTMMASEALKGFTKDFEGCSNVIYKDKFGILRIGYGIPYRKDMPNKISAMQAESMFDLRMIECEDAVRGILATDVSQGIFDALCDYAYSIGPRKFRSCPIAISMYLNTPHMARAQLALWEFATSPEAADHRERRLGELRFWDGEAQS